MRGNCYVTSEAVYHLTGGSEGPWRPATVRVPGHKDVHWYLLHRTTGQVLDLTAAQFIDSPAKPIYDHGRGRGFLTRKPSKRAQILIQSMLWQPDQQRYTT